jgi:uncharacterized protein YkwD
VGATRTNSRWVRGVLAAAVLTLAVTAAACGPTEAPPPAGCPGGPPDAITSSLLNFTNASRAVNGRPDLAWNARLGCLASEWSGVMAGGRGLAHRDLNATIRSPGFESYASLGENIFVGPASISPDAIHTAWWNSEPHRNNILGDFDAMGIGWATSPNGQIWVTENFGRHM